MHGRLVGDSLYWIVLDILVVPSGALHFGMIFLVPVICILHLLHTSIESDRDWTFLLKQDQLSKFKLHCICTASK